MTKHTKCHTTYCHEAPPCGEIHKLSNFHICKNISTVQSSSTLSFKASGFAFPVGHNSFSKDDPLCFLRVNKQNQTWPVVVKCNVAVLTSLQNASDVTDQKGEEPHRVPAEEPCRVTPEVDGKSRHVPSELDGKLTESSPVPAEESCRVPAEEPSQVPAEVDGKLIGTSHVPAEVSCQVPAELGWKLTESNRVPGKESNQVPAEVDGKLIGTGHVQAEESSLVPAEVDGKLIGTGHVQAELDWKLTEFKHVPGEESCQDPSEFDWKLTEPNRVPGEESCQVPSQLDRKLTQSSHVLGEESHQVPT
ncbi:uncharacterized protein LOC120484092 isoform X3 [Pimephales promelas]|uniref:uncharacterized protein LOC120484092 isoform X3 n=1 Tax=Pimephales promelas TaxID=90988 RepID=UPI001955BFED|nr:uncharacterized protein LOC120484092 isoform X3 [Pimephales promelas]